MAVLPPDPLFQSTDLLDITLVAPFDQIDRDRDKEQEYEGSLSYTDANGQEVVLDITLEVRGNDRLVRRKTVDIHNSGWISSAGRRPGRKTRANQ